jgi:Tol biopolymer transport system component
MGLLGITPRWSPDNSLVITSASLSNTSSSYTDQEIIGIFRDGQFERLTYLTDSYPSVQISNASWSPDGKYLAFGFSSDENTSYPDLYPNELPQSTHFRLAVLDIQTRIVTNYCVPLGKYAWVKPIWSPNGNQIALPDVYYHEGDVERKYLYIVDIKAGNVVPIFENAIPIGWLNEGY